jgi:WD40 repeat protein
MIQGNMTDRLNKLLDRLRGLPVRTMAIWLALIAVVFLTRNRWDVWLIEKRFCDVSYKTCHAIVAPGRGRLIVFSYKDRTTLCHICDVEAGRTVATFRRVSVETFGHGRPFGFLSGDIVSPDGTSFIVLLEDEATSRERDRPEPSASLGSYPVVVDLNTGERLCALKGHRGRVYSAAYSPDGSRIVTAGRDRTARVWDARTGRSLFVLRRHAGSVYEAGFSPDGSRIVTVASSSGRVWDARTGELLTVLNPNRGTLYRAVFCSGGRRVLVARPGLCILWDSRTGEQVATLRPAERWAVDPSGRRVGTTDGHGGVYIWDAETGERLSKPEGNKRSRAARWMAFSQNGALVASWGTNFGSPVPIAVWDVGSGACLFALPPLNTKAEFSPTGNLMLTWGGNPIARVWDVRSGELLAEIPDARFSKIIDDRRLFVSNYMTGVWLVYRRVRPEPWWGILWLRHFWVIVALSLALAWSMWSDRRELGSRRP